MVECLAQSSISLRGAGRIWGYPRVGVTAPAPMR